MSLNKETEQKLSKYLLLATWFASYSIMISKLGKQTTILGAPYFWPCAKLREA